MANIKATPKPETDENITSFSSKVDVPEAIKALAEKSFTQTKANYETIRETAEEATDHMEESYLTLSRGTAELQVKAIEATRANLNATFDLAVALTNVKSLSEAIELQTAHARKQFEVLTAQSKDLTQLVNKLATDSAKPYKDLAAKSLKFGS